MASAASSAASDRRLKAAKGFVSAASTASRDGDVVPDRSVAAAAEASLTASASKSNQCGENAFAMAWTTSAQVGDGEGGVGEGGVGGAGAGGVGATAVAFRSAASPAPFGTPPPQQTSAGKSPFVPEV